LVNAANEAESPADCIVTNVATQLPVRAHRLDLVIKKALSGVKTRTVTKKIVDALLDRIRNKAHLACQTFDHCYFAV